MGAHALVAGHEVGRMGRMTCNCHSSNKDTGEHPGVTINQTEYWTGGRPVSVDACMEKVIRHLWKNKVGTEGCCCGHNVEPPSIVITSNQDMSGLRKLIAEVDDRYFDLFQWRLFKHREPRSLTDGEDEET